MRLKTGVAALAVVGAMAPALAHRRAALVPSGVAAGRSAHHVHGAVHVHSGSSDDGRGTIDQIAQEAREAGLDFVVLTDHNTEASLGADSYRHGVLVLCGLEKSTNAGHALVLGLEGLPLRLDGAPDAVVRDVTDLGGFVVVAHPTSTHPARRWTSDLAGVAGLELLNLAEPAAWPRGVGLLGPLARYAADPQGALLSALRYSREPVMLWDRTLASRPLAGIVGSDAHGGLPAHREVFRLASQHLLLPAPFSGDLGSDRALVLDALRNGRGYGALDSLADASGFVLEARSGGSSGGMGDAVPFDGHAEIRAEADAPAGTTLVLLRDGDEVARGPRILHRVTRPGTYRVEAYLDPALVPGGRSIPWILSNPVYLFPQGELDTRAERARRLPGEPPWADSVDVVDDFGAPAIAERWQIDRSQDAAAAAMLEDGALRFDFRLGAGPATYASVCDWGRRDLSSHAGLAFRVRADRRFRFDVQVRVADAGAKDGVRIWRRSVRAETVWRTVAVPFASLESYDRRGGAPALDHTRGLYFHVDEAHLVPGSRGTLWIDDVGLAR